MVAANSPSRVSRCVATALRTVASSFRDVRQSFSIRAADSRRSAASAFTASRTSSLQVCSSPRRISSTRRSICTCAWHSARNSSRSCCSCCNGICAIKACSVPCGLPARDGDAARAARSGMTRGDTCRITLLEPESASFDEAELMPEESIRREMPTALHMDNDPLPLRPEGPGAVVASSSVRTKVVPPSASRSGAAAEPGGGAASEEPLLLTPWEALVTSLFIVHGASPTNDPTP
mmetsp:Transcript_84509/g.167772  ORF Transcript_84509/g.167772 Transcript_84509/m.167772 type:complete len:235 (+) Transcript_84509:466-1170(+)